MLLLDSQSTMMPATVNMNRLATHSPNLNTSTSFDEITEPAIPIGVESFRFRNHSELLGLASTNSRLPDIVGEIAAVKSTITDPLQNNNRLTATIKMDKGELFYRLVAQYTGFPSAAQLPKSYVKVESLSIAELNEFVISASSQEIGFICTVKVTAFTCLHCTNTNAVGVLRVMTKLNNTRAYEADHVLAGDGLNPEDTQAPPFVAGMECRT
ncbi:Rep_fac-A_C domain-containing protein [Raphanus sativus]|nr:Rep_fac-A_C domain-containing protein [Raphanus sativus]